MSNVNNPKYKLRMKALLWAAIILVAAIASVTLGLNQGASMGIVGGLSGAAYGALQGDIACAKAHRIATQMGCLQ